jgi:hypothetical protein
MTNRKFLVGMIVILLSFEIMVLGSCASKPYKLVEPTLPDEQSAVVYFQSLKTVGGTVWDGDYPIGSFEKKMPMMPIIPYKTTPGEHYFFVNASNWIVTRAVLEPNKRYYLRIVSVPSPPFNKFIAVHPVGGNDAETIIKSKVSKTITFTDKWRAKFAKEKRLKEVQKKLQEAKDRSMDVDLSGEHGF